MRRSCGGVCHHQLANREVSLRDVAAHANTLADLGAIWPSHTTVSKRLALVMGMYTATHALRSLVIVNGLVAAWVKANSIWIFLLNLISHEADMGLVMFITLVLESVNRQAVVCLANLLDVVLQAAIRKDLGGLRGCRGRSRQRAKSHSNIGQELRHLEWVALLLLELVDQSVNASLRGLLHLRTCAQLRTSNAQQAVPVIHACVNGPIVALAIDVCHGRTQG